MSLQKLKLPVAVCLGLILGAGVMHEALADQPHMSAALESLKTAREQLEKANADKGGHRAKAIKAIEEAISETKAGIEFDKTH